jgi:RNA polymerase sigma-70 factor (ECF subfamily)
VIELAYYHGLTQSQMAEVLGLPLGTVKTRVRLGMERLREVWIADDAPAERSEAAGRDVKRKGSRTG